MKAVHPTRHSAASSTLPGTVIGEWWRCCRDTAGYFFPLIVIIFVVTSAGSGSLMSHEYLLYNGDVNTGLIPPAFFGAKHPDETAGSLPFTTFSAGYWSDKLALTPYREFLSLQENGHWQQLFTRIISQSFRVTGKSASETSQQISKKISDGASIYGVSDLLLFGERSGSFFVDIRTSVDLQIDLPAAPFLILFSENNGLKRGIHLPLAHMGADIRVYTDISIAHNQPIDLSSFAETCNDITRGRTDFCKGSFLFGATVTLGNGYLNLKTTGGGIRLNDDGTRLTVDADMKLATSGLGLRDNWSLKSPFENGFSLAGAGAGLNAGILLYGENSMIGIALHRIGPMLWRDIHDAELSFRTRGLSLADIYESELSQGAFDPFDSSAGGYFPTTLRGDTLSGGGNRFSWQPARFNLSVGHRIQFRNRRDRNMDALTKYIAASFDYEQSLTPWPGRSFIPRFAVGAENGFLWGIVPVRTGFVFGGTERIASSIRLAVNPRRFRFEADYLAIGTPYWYPRRGLVVSFSVTSALR